MPSLLPTSSVLGSCGSTSTDVGPLSWLIACQVDPPSVLRMNGEPAMYTSSGLLGATATASANTLSTLVSGQCSSDQVAPPSVVLQVPIPPMNIRDAFVG